MHLTRRHFLQQSAAASLAASLLANRPALSAESDRQIIDTHQHLWNLDQFKLPWLEGAEDVLRRSYLPQDYAEATRGLKMRAIYMEVDVDPSQHVAEAEYVIDLARQPQPVTIAATIGGRPADAKFGDYVRRFRDVQAVKGVRQVLHGDSTPAGYCLQKEFVRGIHLLGENGKHFDLCMRAGELSDGAQLAEQCPDTTLILDHCGNADPQAFGKQRGDAQPTHDPEQWRKDIERLAALPNVNCKISGIVARAPRGWTAEFLAPIVNHCLTCFGPERVVFGSDWPVCLLGAPLQDWVTALQQIVAQQPAENQRRLWRENAVRIYKL